MDILFFLKKRTAFIRTLYLTAALPSKERIRKIQEKEEPFDDPPYSEDPEPPFQDEYGESKDSIEVLGQLCLSMLSNSLKLYLDETAAEVQRRFRGVKSPSDTVPEGVWTKKGWMAGYRAYFDAALGIKWGEAPCNLDLLEEIALTRNSVQHPGDITTLLVVQSPPHMKKFPESYFADGWTGLRGTFSLRA